MITLEANYSKKIGLPQYSSHQFSVSLKTELTDLNQVEQESAKLYAKLQQSVDNSIQDIGYLPGNETTPPKLNGKGHQNGHSNGQSQLPTPDKWACSDKQRDLILKITDEHHLEKAKVEQLALDRFGKGVRALNKLEASGLIEELLEQTGQSKPRSQRFQKAGAR
jgi:hypothetical protein